MISPSIPKNVIDLSIAIQQIPAPTFCEEKRAAFVQKMLLEEGLQEVSMDSTGNVYARLPGSGQGKPVVVTAHCDTVFPASTPLDIRREGDRIYGPGIGDNSLGVAGLFGLLWALREEKPLPGDLWVVANVGEEGLGDLAGMKAVVDRFGSEPKAYIVLEGMALGQIYHRALGVQRYRITVRTQGGHSWVDFGRPSAVHELAKIISRLTNLQLPVQPRTTLNVGMVTGGTSVNTIAPEAHLELDLRSEDVQALSTLASQVEAIAREANRPGIQIQCEIIGQRPAGAIALRHPLVLLAVKTIEMLGLQPRLNIGSTDANVPLSRGLPSVCLGLTSGTGAHTTDECIYTAPLSKGLEQVLRVIEGVYQLEDETS